MSKQRKYLQIKFHLRIDHLQGSIRLLLIYSAELKDISTAVALTYTWIIYVPNVHIHREYVHYTQFICVYQLFYLKIDEMMPIIYDWTKSDYRLRHLSIVAYNGMLYQMNFIMITNELL